MKLAFLDLEPWEKEELEKLLLEKGFNQFILSEKSIDEVNLEELRDIEVLSVFIHSKVSREVMEALPKLKLIVTRSTGFDHIDLEAAKEKGIVVCNIPDYGTNTVAEFTILLMLAAARKFNKAINALKQELSLNPEELRGFDLAGKVLGIIGAGRIGTCVAKLAKAFGMQILYYDIRENEELTKLGARKVDLDYLLSNSDFISLHVPLNEHTRHLINRENIRKIKKGAFLINTARGAVVELEALIEALEQGLLRGAALDVIEGEALLKREIDVVKKKADYEEVRKALLGHVLLKFENVIVTPHIAYNTWEALRRILTKTVETIEKFARQEELGNRVA